jgi:hypothetical protein
VDDEGQVHYSDTPHDGATEIDVAPAQTFSLPSTPASSAVQDQSAEQESGPVSYETLQITSPSQEETIWNTGGQVTVAIQLQPGLQTGHRIVVYLDGQKQAGLPSRSSSMGLSEVTRGQHQLKTEVQDENGRVLISSQPLTFFYQQTSVNRRPGL